MTAQDRPWQHSDETILASIAEAFTSKGHHEAAAALLRAVPDLEQTGYDNWDGGTDVWTFSIEVDFATFHSWSEEERSELQSAADRIIGPFLPESGHWANVKFRPAPVQTDGWRDRVSQSIFGDGINNQGRVRSDNVAPIELDGLRFRSHAETLVYKELKRSGVPFAPLPVFLRGGRDYSRVEPDFVLFREGVCVFVEIDGPHHRETPADAFYRLKVFQDEGVVLERIKVEHCDTPAKAAHCVKVLLQALERRSKRPR